MSEQGAFERQPIDRSALLPVIDVLYGALLTYALYAIAQVGKDSLARLYSGEMPVETSLSQGGLVLVVFVSLTCDYILIRTWPSDGGESEHSRFLMEIAFAALYMFMLSLAELRSPLIFLGFAAVHTGRLVWLGMFKHVEARDEFRYAGLSESLMTAVWLLTFHGLPAVEASNTEPGGYPMAREAALMELLALGQLWGRRVFARFVKADSKAPPASDGGDVAPRPANGKAKKTKRRSRA